MKSETSAIVVQGHNGKLKTAGELDTVRGLFEYLFGNFSEWIKKTFFKIKQKPEATAADYRLCTVSPHRVVQMGSNCSKCSNGVLLPSGRPRSELNIRPYSTTTPPRVFCFICLLLSNYSIPFRPFSRDSPFFSYQLGFVVVVNNMPRGECVRYSTRLGEK